MEEKIDDHYNSLLPPLCASRTPCYLVRVFVIVVCYYYCIIVYAIRVASCRTPGKRRRPLRGACPFQRVARLVAGGGRADGRRNGRGASWITYVQSVHLYVRKRNQSRSRHFPCRRCCTAARTSDLARTRRFSPVARPTLVFWFPSFRFRPERSTKLCFVLFCLFPRKFLFSFALRAAVAVASKPRTNFIAGSPSRWTRVRERRRYVFGQGRSAPVRNGTLQETFESKRWNVRPQTERIVALQIQHQSQ